MRNTIVGIIIGIVVGIFIGATFISPRLLSQKASHNQEEPAIITETPEEDLTSPPQTIATPKPEPETTTPEAHAAETKTETPEIRWKMASAYASSMPHFGPLAKRFEKLVWRVSGGKVDIVFHEPGVLVSPSELFDAIVSGEVDAAFSSPALWSDKIPALSLFGGVPFSPSLHERLAWFYGGGGQALFEEIYHRYGLHSLPCGAAPAKGATWLRFNVLALEDIKGLRLQTNGPGGQIMRTLGAKVSDLDPGNALAEMDAGALDGLAFSIPSVDLRLGFHRLAKHYYLPGWNPASFLELLVNHEKWASLSSSHKSQIKAVCGNNLHHGISVGEALQFAALKEIGAKGVNIRRWPKEILQAFEKTWDTIAAEKASSDKDFKRIMKAQAAFHKDYSIWDELKN
jgi:TRAP-type mannitol/chloroaromatic compound transport system substrate-binding protein